MHLESPAPDAVRENVRAALAEDIGSGDVTAMLVAAGTLARARIVTREHAVLCGYGSNGFAGMVRP